MELKKLAGLLTLTLALTLSGGAAAGFAQVPTPGAQGIMSICGTDARQARAGETITYNLGPGRALVITLPGTQQFQFSLPGEIQGAGDGISVCDVPTSSTVLISLTGQEIGRRIGGSGGSADALDKIMANVRIQTTQGPVAPPSTGDGGLLNSR
jgi:hypothetical protein